MLSHNDERPFKCDYCDKSYRQKPVLNDHLKTHLGENTYICDKCPQAFRYAAELRNHSFEHHSMNRMNDGLKDDI